MERRAWTGLAIHSQYFALVSKNFIISNIKIIGGYEYSNQQSVS